MAQYADDLVNSVGDIGEYLRKLIMQVKDNPKSLNGMVDPLNDVDFQDLLPEGGLLANGDIAGVLRANGGSRQQILPNAGEMITDPRLAVPQQPPLPQVIQLPDGRTVPAPTGMIPAPLRGLPAPGPTDMIPAPQRGVPSPEPIGLPGREQLRLPGREQLRLPAPVPSSLSVPATNWRPGDGTVGPRGMTVLDAVPSNVGPRGLITRPAPQGRSYWPEVGVAATAAGLAATAESLLPRGVEPTTPDQLAEESSPMPVGNPAELADVPEATMLPPAPPVPKRQELPPRPGPGTGFIETNRGYALKPAQSRTAEVMLNAGLDPARVEDIVRGQRSLTQNEERAIIRNGPNRNQAELDAIEARRWLRSKGR